VDATISGLPARVVQHETDHLDGILFFDRMKSFETLSYLEEYRRYWARDDDD
jgi:peptide deformylase